MDPAVDDFFTTEIGPSERSPQSDSSRHAPLYRTATRNSILSTRSVASNIFLPTAGVIELSLSDFCAYVNERRSLQRATIVSVEGYHQTVGVVKHRFVLLELSRHGQKNIWLRLDRRRGKGVSILQFVAARGRTLANDIASLSGTRARLQASATIENSWVLDEQPTLADLNRLLIIITEELETYNLWPENCWFFSSLVEQHLVASAVDPFHASPTSIKYAELGPSIRARVLARYHADEDRKATAALMQSLDALKQVDSVWPDARMILYSAERVAKRVYPVNLNNPFDTHLRRGKDDLRLLHLALWELVWGFTPYPCTDDVLNIIAHTRRNLPKAFTGDTVDIGLAHLLYLEGVMLSQAGRYPSAINVLRSSIQLCGKLDHLKNLGVLKNLISSYILSSWVHMEQGQRALALEQVMAAMRLAESGVCRLIPDPISVAEEYGLLHAELLTAILTAYCVLAHFGAASWYGKQLAELSIEAFCSHPLADPGITHGLALEWYQKPLVGLRLQNSNIAELSSVREWRDVMAPLEPVYLAYSYAAEKVRGLDKHVLGPPSAGD
ncbi:hypothetical protein DL93DRAFT_2230586 [Clavulina sp. PMI_390]|nr:hypothetical protein DL93DRAFT_2230586 [Clavulina sp. PMI_390]